MSSYITVDRREYGLVRKADWHRGAFSTALAGREPWNFYSDWLVYPHGDETQEGFIFSIGCIGVFGETVYVPGQIPEELAVSSIQWLLEIEELPSPVDYWYLGVFTQDGLRHRLQGQIDRQFGAQACRTWQGVIEQLKDRRTKALEAGGRKPIGFRPSVSEVWTPKSSILVT